MCLDRWYVRWPRETLELIWYVTADRAQCLEGGMAEKSYEEDRMIEVSYVITQSLQVRSLNERVPGSQDVACSRVSQRDCRVSNVVWIRRRSSLVPESHNVIAVCQMLSGYSAVRRCAVHVKSNAPCFTPRRSSKGVFGPHNQNLHFPKHPESIRPSSQIPSYPFARHWKFVTLIRPTLPA